MTSVNHVFARIAAGLHLYAAQTPESAVQQLFAETAFNLHLAVTTDLAESALDFVRRYGKGQTFHFKLRDYDHGKLLAGQIYQALLGVFPDMSANRGERFAAGEQLYLFVHLKNVHRPALSLRAGEA